MKIENSVSFYTQGGTDEGRRETGQNQVGRWERMTGEKGRVIGREKGYSFSDDIIILLNFIFIGLHGY